MKLAFVVSWLNQYGGAERVLEAAHELFPDAPIYTSIYDPKALPALYRTWDIRTSFLNRIPGIHRRHRLFLPWYPLAFESFDLNRYDTVLSLTSAFAHGVITPAPTYHVCYCLTPARFLWQYHEYIESEAVGRVTRLLLPLMISSLRQWDFIASARVDWFIGISRVVQSRISQFYRRRASIVYPPVQVHRFKPVPRAQVEDYFLILSRLVPYKRIDLAIQAFNRLGLPLVVAGDGRDRPRLEKMANSNIRFLGRVSDEQRCELMARCRALVFPGEEDFGIAPLEANASGRPVIAYAGGGALDTIVEGVNGVLFHKATVDWLAERVRTFDADAFDPEQVRAHAQKFDIHTFQSRLLDELSSPAPSLKYSH